MQRHTKQRELLAACLASAKRPLTAAELHLLAIEEQPSLGIATVYRAIKDFVAQGLVTVLDIGGTLRYELAQQAHHHHFHCHHCDQAHCFDYQPACHLPTPPPGFTIESHELIVTGLCSTCHHATAEAVERQ